MGATSEYVAKDVIYVNGVRAFNPGDPVPAGHVDSGVVDKDQVVGSNTKTAKNLTEGEG